MAQRSAEADDQRRLALTSGLRTERERGNDHQPLRGIMPQDAATQTDGLAAGQESPRLKAGVVRRAGLDSATVMEPTQLGLPGPAGGTAKFTDNGGPMLQVVQLFLIYWGSAWSANPPPTPTAGEITSACSTMIQSSYMPGLAQYRGLTSEPHTAERWAVAQRILDAFALGSGHRR